MTFFDFPRSDSTRHFSALKRDGLYLEALYYFSVLKRNELQPEGIENERMFVLTPQNRTDCLKLKQTFVR